MKTLKLTSITILSFMMIMHSTVVFAQHNHGSHGGSHTSHEQLPPNGGVIKSAGKYKIEMVANMFLKQDQLSFYLLKNNLKTIPTEGITGSITIKQDGTSTTEDLVIKGNERFVAQLNNTNSFQANVEFIIKGKTFSAVFVHNGLGQHNASKYTCSMHPEIENDGPGKCPKCGMNLVPKEDNTGGNEGHNHNH